MGKAMTPTNHPAPESEREAIARIIHPEAFDGTLSGHPDNWEDKMAALENQAEAQLVALTKADAILSRRGEPVGWTAYCPSTGGRVLEYTEAGARERGQICYAPACFIVEPLYASPPAPALDWHKDFQERTRALRDSGAPEQPRGESAQTNATQPVGSPNNPPALDARTVEALERIIEWWDGLPPRLRQDIEGSGNEPGCIAHARCALAARADKGK
jgi:hypothetical protein